MVFHKPETLDELMIPYNSETLNKILTDEHKVIKQKD